MADVYLQLPREEQSNILRALAPQLGQTPTVLEKDVWVVWVLEQLFKMPDRLPMAFKGGTSLSKVFQAINRFSEDVDITLDYRSLASGVDPFDSKMTRSKLKRLSEHLKERVHKHVAGTIVPYLENQLATELGNQTFTVDIGDDGETVRVHYPSALEDKGTYIQESVLIEFGGRNVTKPSGGHLVRPYLAEGIGDLFFPNATVEVLAPERTFWEKATLIHAECHRPEFKASAARLSRHWYDLAMLAASPIGETAMNDRDLLADVVRHKDTFFHSSSANYEACLTSSFRLIPGETELASLQADFEQMIEAGMFFVEPPSFSEIIERLRQLETRINL